MARNNGAPALAEPRRTAGFAAAARQIDLGKKEANGYRRRAQAAEWQRDSFAYFKAIGIVKQATLFLANTCSLTRLFVAWQPDPEQDPVPVDSSVVGGAEARDALQRLADFAKGGHAGIIQRTVLLLKATGECYLVGFDPRPAKPADPVANKPEVPAQPERWLVASVAELTSEGTGSASTYKLKESRSAEAINLETNSADDEPGVMVFRIWQEDAEFADEADCALHGALNDCEELLAHGRSVRASLRNRYALNGIFIVPSEAEVAPPEETAEGEPDAVDVGEDPQAAALAKKILDAMVAAIENEGSAAGAAPIIIRVPGEHADKFKHLTFERPSDSSGQDRHECIERLAMALDIPLEEVVGMGGGRSSGALFMSGNTAQQMEQKLFNRYGHPAMVTVCEALTVGFLRPMIEAANVDGDAARKLMVWYEPGDAIADPDPAESANDAFDRAAISWSTYRTAKGFNDDDAPDDDELDRRKELGLLGKATASSDPTKDSASLPSSPPPEGGATTNGHRADFIPITSAATRRTGRTSPATRLTRIDRDLRLRLGEMADLSMRRALEKAGARVRNTAARSARIRDTVARVPALMVPATLGRAVVADALGMTDDDLLRDAFDDLGPRFNDRVGRAQGQALDALAVDLNLDESEIAALTQRQDDDRHAAWAWLAAAMVALAHDRLYSPAPEAPPRGEFDSSATVPPGIVREALARSGGAVGVSPDQPAAGVALGQLVQDTWAAHGRVVDGWRWVYGDPSSRTTPFDSHVELDGVEFQGWEDDVLLNPSDWPPVTFLRPGDHMWCQCDFEAVGLGGESDDADAEAMANAE